jgi:hypothetical protein
LQVCGLFEFCQLCMCHCLNLLRKAFYPTVLSFTLVRIPLLLMRCPKLNSVQLSSPLGLQAGTASALFYSVVLVFVQPELESFSSTLPSGLLSFNAYEGVCSPLECMNNCSPGYRLPSHVSKSFRIVFGLSHVVAPPSPPQPVPPTHSREVCTPLTTEGQIIR